MNMIAPTPRKKTRALLIVFGAALAQLILIGPAFWRPAYAPNSYDEARYVFYAESIRAGAGMHAPGYPEKPTAYVMPLLPLALAPLDPSSTELGSLVRLRLFQLACCALTALMTFELGRRLGGERMAYLALLCLLLNLGWMLQALYILTEPLFTLLLTAATALLIWRPESYRALAGAGLLLGLAWLTRGALFGTLALMLLYLLWRAGVKKTAWLSLCLGLTILPWGLRNQAAFGSFLLTSTQSGNVLAGAYNDRVDQNPWEQGWINPDELYGAEAQAGGFFDDELRYSNFQTEKGLAWIGANPERLPRLWAAHTFGFLRPWLFIARNPAEKIYELAAWALGGGLLLYGLAYHLRRPSGPWWLLGLSLAGGLALAVLFYGIPRFRLPYAPVMALFQAQALCLVWERWVARRETATSAGS
jgi:hypothetical protein